MDSSQRLLHGAGSGEDVHLLQLALERSGFDPGPVDGIYGSRTTEAVQAYQQSRSLPVDGVVGSGTWARLSTKKMRGLS